MGGDALHGCGWFFYIAARRQLTEASRGRYEAWGTAKLYVARKPWRCACVQVLGAKNAAVHHYKRLRVITERTSRTIDTQWRSGERYNDLSLSMRSTAMRALHSLSDERCGAVYWTAAMPQAGIRSEGQEDG